MMWFCSKHALAMYAHAIVQSCHKAGENQARTYFSLGSKNSKEMQGIK